MELESHRSNTVWPLVTGHTYLTGFPLAASDVGFAPLGQISHLVSTDLVLNISGIAAWVG